MNSITHGAWGVSLALACLTAGSVVTSDDDDLGELEQRLENIREEFRTAERAMMKAYDVAETDKQRAAALAVNPWEGLRERCDELAFAAAGTEVAAGAWSMICLKEFRYGTNEPAWEAFHILINDHKDSEELNDVIARMPNYGRENKDAIAGLHQLVETSETRSVQAGSLFSLAKMLESADATRDEAFGYYRRLAADYAELDAGRGSTFGQKATAALFEAEYLQVGLPVPDIASIDETNAAFNLSDYKGKVVLVDFWGFW